MYLHPPIRRGFDANNLVRYLIGGVARSITFPGNGFRSLRPSVSLWPSIKILRSSRLFRVRRTERHCQRLADGLNRHGRFHRLVGDLYPADSSPVIEIHLGWVVNRALLALYF